MDIQGAIRRLQARVSAMVTRAVISVVNDGLKTQRLQLTILADEVEDDVEHMQPYGLSFVPPAGSEAVALAMSGSRAHTVAICVQNPNERPTGNPARTGGLYTNKQWRLFIDEAGIVHVGAQEGAEFIALADKVKTELDAIKSDLDGFKSAYDLHTHTVSTTGTATAQAGTAAATTSSAPAPHTPASVAATKAKAT